MPASVVGALRRARSMRAIQITRSGTYRGFGQRGAACSGARSSGPGWGNGKATAGLFDAPLQKPSSQPTLRWREMDSNFPHAGAVSLVVAPFCRVDPLGAVRSNES